MAALIGDALRQAFMQKQEYESLRDEDKAWSKLQRPMLIFVLAVITLSILISTIVSLRIIFPTDPGSRPLCKDMRMQPLSISFSTRIIVSYTAPMRHGCLNVVENNYCASKRGGVRCLSIINLVFGIIFGLLSLFLGSTLLTLGSRCSISLFWCYEIASLGLVILYGGTAFYLRRKAATILDESDFAGRNLGLEMLEAEFSPDVERRVNEGFRSWMGSSYLSSDDDDKDKIDPQHLSRANSSSRQRV